jgi:hypothetical protein
MKIIKTANRGKSNQKNIKNKILITVVPNWSAVSFL